MAKPMFFYVGVYDSVHDAEQEALAAIEQAERVG